MAKAAKVRLPDGTMVDGVAVDVAESTERWSEVTLADGTKLKMKMSVISAARSDKHFDTQGRPVYAIEAAPQIVISEIPENLMGKKQ